MEQSKEPYVDTSVPQSPPPVYGTPSSWDRIQEFMNSFWVYEILASIISLVMLAAIFCVLHHYNSTDVALWSHSWSLNSLVGLLATISQISMAVPLTSGISQLKWVWYKDSQKLSDLDKFDQSSRGPMGSAKLLFSRPFKFLGAFGAIVTILALAFHTLIQNAITTKSGLIQLSPFDADELGGVSFPQGNNYSLYNKYSTGDTLGDQGAALDMVADINYGMFYSAMHPDTQFQQSLATCYTGNCTWDHIQTLSVCYKCADITSKIGVDDGSYTLYSTTLDMRQDIGLVTSLGDTEYPDPSVLPGVGPLIVHLTTMARATVDDDPVGIDCALFWCVEDESQVAMINYNVTSNVTAWTDTSESAKTTYQQDTDVTLTPPTCYDQYGNTVSDTTKCTKTILSYAQLGIQNFFIGSKTGFTGSAVKNTTTNGWGISSEFIQLLYTTVGTSDNFLGSLQKYMDYIGFMMMSNIRQQTPQAGFPSSLGQMYSWTTQIHIRWGFLIVPTITALMTMLFILVTIFKSLGQEKWKSSLLPLLYHPLRERPAVAPQNMSDIKAVAEATEVRLERGVSGSHFV